MKVYRTVFFDLDHTLWDYDKNSRETLEELYAIHHINQHGHVDFNQFHEAFQEVNLRLWDQYDRGLIDRHVIRHDRFKMVLAKLNVENGDLAFELSEQYITLSPTKKNLIPNAVEVLDYLMPRYSLLLVTNGFNETQSTKVTSGGIDKYFKSIITSEMAGHKKPSKEIFEFALNQGDYVNHETIMIGDNLLTDIAGAANARIDSVLFNPRKERHESMVTHEISDLIELKAIL